VASIVALFTPPSRKPAHGHRGPRSGSNLGWLRPALAVAGAVVIVVAGVYGLAQVRHNLVLELFPRGTQASNSPGSSGGGGQPPTLNGQTAPTGIVPSTSQTGSARPSPRASCSSTPEAQATPTAPATGTPTPTNSPSSSPTDSTTPSPTDSPTVTRRPARCPSAARASGRRRASPGPAAGRPARPRARSRRIDPARRHRRSAHHRQVTVGQLTAGQLTTGRRG